MVRLAPEDRLRLVGAGEGRGEAQDFEEEVPVPAFETAFDFRNGKNPVGESVPDDGRGWRPGQVPAVSGSSAADPRALGDRRPERFRDLREIARARRRAGWERPLTERGLVPFFLRGEDPSVSAER